MGTLTSKTPGTPDFTYLGLLHLEANTEITSLLQKIQDGGGNDTGLEISTTALKYTGNLTLASLTASTLVYLDSNKKLVSLAAGSAGDVLTLAGGLPTWAAPATGITIDTTPITGGGSGRILYESTTGKVSESNSFKVDSGKFVFGATSASALVHFEDISTNQTALLVNGYGGAYSGGLLPYIVDIRGRTGIGRFTIDSYGYVGFGTGAGNNYHTSNYKVDFGDGRVLMGNSLHLSTNTNDKRFQIVYGGYYAYMSNDRDVSVSLKLFADSGMRVTMFTNGNNFPSLIVFGNLVRQQYSNSVFQDVTVGSTGLVTYDAVGSGAGFKFMKPINLQNLPTSASGLSSGDVWNDSGTLKIV